MSEKPVCVLVGENGNIFNLVGKASSVLRSNGLGKQVSELQTKILNSKSYNEALAVISEYVEVV